MPIEPSSDSKCSAESMWMPLVRPSNDAVNIEDEKAEVFIARHPFVACSWKDLRND
jgi:hypothetical protein